MNLRTLTFSNPLAFVLDCKALGSDNFAVHPERYALVERMAADLGIPLVELLPRVAS